MIEVIGFRRFVIIISLVLMNIGLAALTYFYLVPESSEAEKRLSRVERNVRSAKGDLNRMQVEFEILERQQDRFDALKKAGYFSNQVRSDVRELLSKVRKEAGVISAVANVEKGKVSDSFGVSKVNYKVLTSIINVSIEAFDDADVYRYVDLLQRRFPGDVTIDSLSIRRSKDVSSVVLRAIASGRGPSLVSASLTASWSTLIPDNQVIGE